MEPKIQTIERKDFPYRLRKEIENGNIKEAPERLHVKSVTPADELLDSKHSVFITIVGSRDMTKETKRTVYRTVSKLKEKYGDLLVIVSGLAIGTDTAAHLAALGVGARTLAVIANGVGDRTYPTMNENLAELIGSRPGCGIISQFPNGTAPQAINFLMRNQIIAGLSDKIVVMQTKKKGSAMMTARYGNALERKVYAFPGRYDDPNYEGCNTLIKTGIAKIVDDLNEI